MAKSRRLSLLSLTLLLCGPLLFVCGRYLCRRSQHDPSATPTATQDARSTAHASRTSTVAPIPLGSNESSATHRASAIPPVNTPASSQQLDAMNLADLLALGRQWALAGGLLSLQRLFGHALVRHIRREPANTVRGLMPILADIREPATLRQTILEALAATKSSLPDDVLADLFYQSLHIMQHDSDPALRAAALRAASAFTTALANSPKQLSTATLADFDHQMLNYVESAGTPIPLRQAAIVELATGNSSADLVSALRAILDNPAASPTVILRCAGVAMADLRQADAVPAMVAIINNTADPELFLSMAYAMACLSTNDGLRALVDNATRFEGTCQPYIARQQQQIEGIITDADAEYLTTAIKAIYFFPEKEQRRQLTTRAADAVLNTKTPRDPYVVKALLGVVADHVTPDECRKVIAQISEEQQWRAEWQRVKDRSRAVTGIVVGYRSID